MALIAFTAGFVVFGVIYSFGVFLETMAREFGASRSATSAYFSVASLAFYFLGPFTGAISDKLGPRFMIAVGAASMGAGLALTAAIDRLWLGYVTYGLGVGLGAACVYVPTVANLGGWFDRHRNAAFGLAAAGTGCGGLIVPPLAALLIANFGWRYADIALGIGSAVLLGACALVARRPPVDAQAQAKQNLRAIIGSIQFMTIYISWLLGTIALFVPFVYLPAFATELGASEFAASLLLALLGGVSILGRLGIGELTKRWTTLAVYKAAILGMAGSYVLWLLRPEYQWLVAFALLLGLAYGVRIALVTGVLIEYFGMQGLGALLGIFFTATGIAAALGPTLAGLIVDHTGGYAWAIAFAIITGTAGYLVIAPLRPPAQNTCTKAP